MPRSYFENCGNSRVRISLPHPGKAAGAELTHSRHGEVMTKKNNTGLFPRPFDWNKIVQKAHNVITSDYLCGVAV